MTPLILASASPRRRELLAGADIDFEVVPSGFDEATVRHLPPRRQAAAAARGKALKVARRHPGRWVAGCDTVVALGEVSFGKPADPGDARRMLGRLAGRDHLVVSAVCVVAPGGRRRTAVATSRVRMAGLSPAEVRAYVAGGEPLDKAGAYAIQGQADRFTRVVRGRQDTVVGLPVDLLRRLLGDLGWAAGDGVSANLARP